VKYLVWWKKFIVELGERGRFREYEGDGSKIWGKDKCRSEMIREVRYGRRKEF